MQTNHETDTLESHLRSLRDVPAIPKKIESDAPEIQQRIDIFGAIRAADRAEVDEAWNKSRAITPTPGWELDCFQRVEILPPEVPIECERAVVLVLGPGYEQMCEWLLETLRTFGESPEARIVLFCLDEAYQNLQGIESRVPNVTRIRCRSVERVTAAVKGVIYSLSRWVKARSVITLECDMLIAGSLQPLWSTIEQSQSQGIMGCAPDASNAGLRLRISAAMNRALMLDSDIEWITGIADYDTFCWFNGGLLAGKYEAWQRFDRLISSWMPYCALWIEGFTRPFGDEIVMNMAVGQMEDRVVLAPCWNVQSFTSNRQRWFNTNRSTQKVEYLHPSGDVACILHFAASARHMMRNVFYELLLNAISQMKQSKRDALSM